MRYIVYGFYTGILLILVGCAGFTKDFASSDFASEYDSWNKEGVSDTIKQQNMKECGEYANIKYPQQPDLYEQERGKEYDICMSNKGYFKRYNRNPITKKIIDVHDFSWDKNNYYSVEQIVTDERDCEKLTSAKFPRPNNVASKSLYAFQQCMIDHGYKFYPRGMDGKHPSYCRFFDHTDSPACKSVPFGGNIKFLKE